MGYPRKLVVDSKVSGFYHCVSRCVRRAFLCGGAHEHRRSWFEQRLLELHEIFAIQPAAYAIMSNHLHLVIRTDPELAGSWSDLEVARRWMRLYPRKLDRIRCNGGGGRKGEQAVEQYIEGLAANTSIIGRLRHRLCDLGWFHKLLKEPIAQRANEEDGCTGYFWEGRFKSYRLLDEGALLACTVYVDLNPWRAGVAEDLKDSRFTSLLERMKVHESERRAKGRRSKKASKRRRRKTMCIRRTIGDLLISTKSLFQMPTEQYLSLVASTAGMPRDLVDHASRLRSLDIDPDRWLAVLGATAKLFGSVVGHALGRLKEAERRGARRVVNTLDVFTTG